MQLIFLFYLLFPWHDIEFTLAPIELCHDFHISKSEINYDSKSGDIQIACHIYIDDLERALEEMGQKHLFLCTPKEVDQGDKAIEGYLNKKLIIRTGLEILHITMIGKETSNDKLAVWCYLEIPGLKNKSNFNVENKLLLEIYNDQKNIVDFTVDKKKKHFTIFDSKVVSQTYKL